jgi:hypothetical protein
MACGLCWSWLWVASAGATHRPATTTADTASNDNRHGLPLTLIPSDREWTIDGRAAEGLDMRPASCPAVGATRSAPTQGATRQPLYRRVHGAHLALAPPLPLA